MSGSVYLLSYDYPPNGGGIARLAAEIGAGLVKADWRVSGATVRRTSGDHRPDAAVALAAVPSQRPWRDLAVLYRLLRLPRDTTVLSTNWRPEGVLARLAGRRLVVLAHGNEVMPYNTSAAMNRRERSRTRTLSEAAAVVCNSRYTEGLVRRLSASAKTVVINPGVDLQRFRPNDQRDRLRQQFGLPPTDLLLLTVARLDRHKGHDTVLRAIAQLPQGERRGVTYAIAGDGPQHDHLLRLAHQLDVAENVVWLGFVDDRSLPELYATADVVLLCSREDRVTRAVEGFGMALLEAQAVGIPVIGTRSGGIVDAVVPAEGGWLVDTDDAAALALLLRNCLANPRELRDQGALGRARVERVGGWDSYIDQLLAVLVGAQ